MSLDLREPTGRPAWPMMLVAGADHAGKSWACAEASGSDLIGRTVWIGCGENDPDEYANVPGARFLIARHNGSYRALLNTCKDAAALPPAEDGRPTLIVFDSATRLWNMLCDLAQQAANQRAAAKAARSNRAAPEDDVQITMDLWNVAKDRWSAVMDALRSHQGPVVLTARLEVVTVVDGRGEPTRERTAKVQAEKSLPFTADVVVHLESRGEATLTGVKSTRLQLDKPRPLQSFTVDGLWRELGLGEVDTGARQHTAAAGEEEPPHVTRARAVIKSMPSPEKFEQLKAWAMEHGLTVGSTMTEDQSVALCDYAASLLTDRPAERVPGDAAETTEWNAAQPPRATDQTWLKAWRAVVLAAPNSQVLDAQLASLADQWAVRRLAEADHTDAKALVLERREELDLDAERAAMDDDSKAIA